MAALLDRIQRRYGLAADAEVTIEANPGPDERGDLAGFRAAGVTRVSFGAQSLDAAELRRLGRRHRPADVVEAVEAARRAGIAHRSIDLLYDVPGQSMATWQATVERALDLPIDHLSAYALTLDDPDAAGLTGPTGDHLPVRPGRPTLAPRRRQRSRTTTEPPTSTCGSTSASHAAGFSWYEVSNWARPGGDSRHNQAYWRRRATRRRRPGRARLRRWPAPDLERGPARWLSGCAHARRL